MEVSLTPKKELGRLIYTFSATAYQVANVHQVYWHANIKGAAANNPSNLGAGVFSDSNINIVKTLNDYGFFNIGTYKTDINYTDKDWRIGQISCYGGYNENTHLPIIANTNLTDISKAIINKYWGNVKNLETGIQIEDMDQNDNIYISDMLIKDIHIETDNAPYLVDGANGISNGTFYEKDQLKNFSELGTVINFSGQSILVAPPHRIYNIMEDRVYSIKDTSFNIENFIGTVDFLYKLKYSIDRTKQSYKTTSKNVAGYLDYDDIKLNGNMINLIHMKYSQNYQTESDIVNSRITGINNIIIDSDPGTVIDITTKDNPVGANSEIINSRLVVNETGILKLNTILLNSFITSLQIKGVLEKGILNPNKKPDILLYYFITTKTEYTKRNV